jgi:hypothetical protein
MNKQNHRYYEAMKKAYKKAEYDEESMGILTFCIAEYLLDRDRVKESEAPDEPSTSEFKEKIFLSTYLKTPYDLFDEFLKGKPVLIKSFEYLSLNNAIKITYQDS